MSDLALDPGIFIRSMATRGETGGLARATLDAVDILDVAGFDTIIIETVGVGQDEVEIARAAHTTVVVSAPGLGDEIQAIKAGILEIADIHVVSKCDRPDSNRTITDLKHMLALGAHASGKSGMERAGDRRQLLQGRGLQGTDGGARASPRRLRWHELRPSRGACTSPSSAWRGSPRCSCSNASNASAKDLRKNSPPASSHRESDPYSLAEALVADALNGARHR